MQWQGDERILVMRCDDIGQMIMATPALRAVRNSVPDGHITLMTSHTAGGLMPCLEDVDEIIPMTALWYDRKKELPFDPEREQGFVEELRDGRFDAAIILTNQTQSSLPAAYACYMAGIEVRVGRSAEAAGSLLTHRVRGFGQGHEIERCLEVVAACGMHEDDLRPRLGRDEKLREGVDQFLKNHGVLDQPYVVVHAAPLPGSTEATTSAFAQAMVEVSRRFGYLALMTGLPQERVAVEWVAGEAGTSSVVIAGETSVAELAAIIEGAQLVITGNTSPAHIASAYNVPSLIIYEDMLPPSQWLPWSRSDCAAVDDDLGEKLVALMGASEGQVATAAAS